MALPKIKKQIEARVKDTGDSMSGGLEIKNTGPMFTMTNSTSGQDMRLYPASNSTILLNRNVAGDSTNYRALYLHNSTASSSINSALVLQDTINGTANNYNLLHAGNYNNYAPTKGGTGASGTWGIGISGNSATATKLQTARSIQIGNLSKTFDGTTDISYTPYQMGLTRAQYGVDNSMNVIADNGCELGMASLSSSDTTINPGGQTGWHHYINMTWANAADNDGTTNNEWCTQIANKCGTTDLWVRSRSGSTIADGTAWVAPWTRILTGSNWGHVISKATLGAMGAKHANSFYGMTQPDGADNNWIRTTTLGLIPYSSGNANDSALGTSSWPFGNIYGTTYYTGTQKGLLAAVQSRTPSTNSLWAW